MKVISFQDSDKDNVAFQQLGESTVHVIARDNDDSETVIVALDFHQLLALKEWLNDYLAEAIGKQDPEYIRRYEV